MSDKTTAIAVREAQVPAAPMELGIDDVIAQVQKIQHVMHRVMKEGEHYGKIPGTPKPTLLKPGAEKLLLTFRLCPDYEVVQSEVTDDRVRYVIRCSLTHIPTGDRIATGVGSCSSAERKYQRNAARDIENTILKMASKRALVAAVLNGTAASDIFTQDLEDMDVAEARRQAPAPRAEAATEVQGTAMSTPAQHQRIVNLWVRVGLETGPARVADLKEHAKVDRLSALSFDAAERYAELLVDRAKGVTA